MSTWYETVGREGRPLFRGAMLVALLVGCSRPTTTPLRLAQSAANATRLEVDRAALAPARVIAAPDELRWEARGGRIEIADGVVRLQGQGEVEARAIVATTNGVEYLLSARGRGENLRLFAESGVVTSGSRGADRSTAELFPASDGTVELLVRTPPVRRDLELRIAGRGSVELLALEIREASLRQYQQRVSGEDAALRALVRRPVGWETARTLDALLATGESVYEWPLPPLEADRVLSFETAVVPRHADRVRPPGPLQMRIEILGEAGWSVPARWIRGGAGDEGGWQEREVALGRARAIRLVTARSPEPPGGAGPATVAWGSAVVRPLGRPRLPDVIHISVEALRPDRLGAYGSRLGLTPRIDKLAAAGVVFEEARAPFGETWQSLTGTAFARFPAEVAVFHRGDAVARGMRSVADEFGEAGYHTAHIGYLLISSGQLGVVDVEDQTTSDAATLARVEALLSAQRDRPLYLRVHIDATHYPYDARPPFRPPGETGPLSQAEFEAIVNAGGPPAAFERLETLYRAALRQSDEAIGRLVDRVTRPDRPGGPALVAVMADHGSHRGERGVHFLHSTLYRPVLHVPLVLAGPGMPAGRRVQRLVRLIDVGPTLLDYAGVPHGDFTGRSLRPLIEGRPTVGRVNMIKLPELGMVVVENDRYKLIANPRRLAQVWPRITGQLGMSTVALYDWRSDPAEKRDLFGFEPLVAGELWRQATAARATLERRMSADARRLLEQAGYAEPVAP